MLAAFPPRSTIGIIDIVEAYNIIRKREFDTVEIQKLTLFGYSLTGVVLGETVGNPGTPSNILSSATGPDDLFGSKEFEKLKAEITNFNAVQARFGGDTGADVTMGRKMLNQQIANIGKQLDILDNKTE